MLGPDAAFRDGQLDAILNAVDDRARTPVVQRTGWGKSLVYFIAAKIPRTRARAGAAGQSAAVADAQLVPRPRRGAPRLSRKTRRARAVVKRPLIVRRARSARAVQARVRSRRVRRDRRHLDLAVVRPGTGVNSAGFNQMPRLGVSCGVTLARAPPRFEPRTPMMVARQCRSRDP
jgi:hypothetical protein